MTRRKPPFDEIGYWSEIKLEIIKEYAAPYSRIMSAQQHPRLQHVYIDGFAGAGQHVSRTSGEIVAGSPTVALEVDPPFTHYYFIDIEATKTQQLEQVAGQRSDVDVFHGDCNKVLLEKVFPEVDYKDFKRGLCLLDPYGLHLDWQVIAAAGQSRSIEIFLNFPMTDINRNVLRRDPEKTRTDQAERLTRYWGDDSWRQVAYRSVPGLFGDMEEKTTNEALAKAFRTRLREVAGFQYVPEPILMRNTKGGPLYYLYFAAHKPVAAKIVRDILSKYRNRARP